MYKPLSWVTMLCGFAASGSLLAALASPVKADTFAVTNTANSGPGSLRLAINQANAKPGSTITFNIPGTGIQALSPTGKLPTITAAGTIIDGFTQPGSVNRDNNISQRPIVLDGSLISGGGDLLQVDAANVQITGLTLTKAQRSAIHVLGGNATITKNLIFQNKGAGIEVDRFAGASVLASNGSDQNGGLGIDWRKAGDQPGVTNNDTGDVDGIPNRTKINSAKLTFDSATGDAHSVITGTLTAAPNSSYKIELFVSPDLNASGFGEGLLTLGDTGFLKTDANGVLNWSFTGAFFGGGYVSATVTRSFGSNRFATGEFARSATFLSGRKLTFSGLPAGVKEGDPGVTVTVSRDAADSDALTVQLLTSPENQLDVPAAVVIPGGQTSTTFTLSAVDDDLPDGDVGVGIAALASGYTPVGGIVRVRDNEGPTLTLQFDATFVREGGTPIHSVVKRNSNFGAPLIVNLSSSPSGQLTLPSSITIPANEDEADFFVSAPIDNIPEGNRTITVTPSAPGFTGVSKNIGLHDGETVDLSLSMPSLVNEGDHSVFTGQVSRTGATTASLTVSLAVDTPGQLTLPSSVTIPAGQASASFSFQVVDDAIAEPSPRTVQITASRSGTTPSTTFVDIVDNDFSGGVLTGWGYNEFGQVGNGTTTNQNAPVNLFLFNVASVSANGSHSLAVLSDGSVEAWGYNGAGQLGDGTQTDHSTPRFVSGIFNVRAVAAGWYHSLALRSDGTVWAWGYNKFGQLGDGTTIRRLLPVQVQGLTNVKAIAAGVYFSLALKNDGTVWAWGDDTYGQLGDDSSGSFSSVPKQISGLSNITAIAAGGGHALFLRSNGTVAACGWNAYEQLGAGTSDSGVPVTVPGVSGITAISAGYVHSLALKNTGEVMGWGNNDYGQLGFGANGSDPSHQPPSTMGLTGITKIAAGANFSVAIVNSGAVYATGDNTVDQLGGATGLSQLFSPAQVPTLTSGSAVAAAYGHTLAIAGITSGPGAIKAGALPSVKHF